MIGVIANSADHDVVREFFELFKTPWEFCRRDQQYDVLLCAGDGQFDAAAKLIIFFAGRRTHFDDQEQIETSKPPQQACILTSGGNRIPIYGDTITFSTRCTRILTEEGSQECVAFLDGVEDRLLARVGYDLFSEIRTLLTVGQPLANANMPALELHIAFLRDVITARGISLVEIPPVPEGFQFVACLTHDVDHPSIRQQELDHTIVGFLLRATFGSLVDAFLGRMSFGDLARNWVAAVKLPFVRLGLAKDFWRDFDDRYLKLEKGLPSTFFIIPRKNYAGKRVDGRAAALRASGYEARELADTICKLRAAGREIGLHGIDAWTDSASGREELEEIRRLTGDSEIGVRMHWLYFDQESPTILESAEAAYDSTSGYNETVGYRAGTTQAYKPPTAKRMLELPLHAMDTALFYLSYLGLSQRKASARLREMTDTVAQYGGCLTINWHDRSLAPERLWGACYRELIQDLKTRGAWFATVGEAVAWFRKRRSAKFKMGCTAASAISAHLASKGGGQLPGLRLRVHNPGHVSTSSNIEPQSYVDLEINESEDA
jgi:peptidoglycan/xylan/chitin deacetylase (PgdA/CDA1 family)